MKSALLLGFFVSAVAEFNVDRFDGTADFSENGFFIVDTHCFGKTARRECSTKRSNLCDHSSRMHAGQCEEEITIYKGRGYTPYAGGDCSNLRTTQDFCIANTSRPGGCFLEESSKTIFFNSVAEGSENSGDLALCETCSRDEPAGSVTITLYRRNHSHDDEAVLDLMIYQVKDSHSQINDKSINDILDCKERTKGIEDISHDFRFFKEVQFDSKGSYSITEIFLGAGKRREATIALSSCDHTIGNIEYRITYTDNGRYAEGTGPYNCEADEDSMRSYGGKIAGLAVGIFVIFLVIIGILYLVLDQFHKARGVDFRHSVISADDGGTINLTEMNKDVQHYEA